MWEITLSTGRRDPITGRYGQVSRTVRGPTRTKAGNVPRAVELEVAKLVAETDAGRHAGSRHTLASTIDAYLLHQQARGRAPKTLLEGRRLAERIAADDIGSRDIRRLTGLDFDAFYLRLGSTGGRGKDGLHVTSRHHYHALMRAALNQAIRWRWLPPPNPIGEAEAPPLRPDERTPPTPAQVRRLALAVTNDNVDLASLIFVDATTGMRRGEITGLRFCDINWDGSEATVWWRCSDLPAGEAAKLVEGRNNVVRVWPELGVAMLAATKNKKRRRFALDPVTLAVLVEQHKRAKDRCKALGVELDPEAFVWSQEPDHSVPWRPGRVSYAFTALRDKEGLRHVALNDLRHFSATQLLAAGIDPRAIAARHGHDASVLLRVYAHALPARDQEAARVLGELMTGEDG